jgi:predicted sulfurtransferase
VVLFLSFVLFLICFCFVFCVFFVLKLPTRGRLFSFDDRLGQAVTQDEIGICNDCRGPAGKHRNCEFVPCHELVLQCESCHQKKFGACSISCMEYLLGKKKSSSAVV